MSASTPNIPILKPEATVLPPPVLENLAARFRPGGLFLVVLRQDGSVAYHDPGAGVFFERYVLPLLKLPDAAGQSLRERLEGLPPPVPGGSGGSTNGSAGGGSNTATAPGVTVWQLAGV